MGLRLKLRAPLACRLELTALTLHHKIAPTPADAERLPLPYGTKLVPLGEFFSVRPSSSDVLEIDGDQRLDGVGAGFARGRILVQGDCGVALGAGISGGHIDVDGNCGAFVGAEMIGGRITVSGSAGDRVGAALAGQRRGMIGGTVLVNGDAGDRVAERMRGGTIVISGSVGSRPAARMIAGTLAIGGTIGGGAGFGMRRGTILCRRTPERMPLGFADAGNHDLVFLAFLRLAVPEAGDLFDLTASARARRLVGDSNAGGQGEFLVLS